MEEIVFSVLCHNLRGSLLSGKVSLLMSKQKFLVIRNYIPGTLFHFAKVHFHVQNCQVYLAKTTIGIMRNLK